MRLLEERKVLSKLLTKCQTISSSMQEKLLLFNTESSSKVRELAYVAMTYMLAKICVRLPRPDEHVHVQYMKISAGKFVLYPL